MKLEKINVEGNGTSGITCYDVFFDDGFRADVRYNKGRSMGATVYTEHFVVAYQGEQELGETYLGKAGRSHPPQKNRNTIPGEHLDTVVEHFLAVSSNAKVREKSSEREPMFGLVLTLQKMLDLYRDEKKKYESRQAEEEKDGKQTFTF